MQFSIIITVPTESNGWTGTIHLPTIQIQAPTKPDAIERMFDVIKYMPKGTSFYTVAI